VTIVIKNSRGRVVKTLGKYAKRPMCLPLMCKFRCKLAKGRYRYYVKATDAAGNRAAKIGNARLTVK